MRRFLASATLIAGLALSTLALADPEGGPGGHFHDHHPDGFMMHELHNLNLTDAQRTQIHGFFETAHEQDKASHAAMHQLHRSYDLAVPGTAAFNSLTTQMADAEAAQAREHVQQMAEIRTQIYGVLTAAQRQQLATDLANRPEPPAPQ